MLNERPAESQWLPTRVIAATARLARGRTCAGLLPLLVALVLGSTSLAQGTADIMHRARGWDQDDALLRAFNGVLVGSKNGDWDEIARTVGAIDPQMDRYQELFRVDAKSKLRRSIAQRDADSTLRYLAQVVYLGMKEQFHTIMDDEMRDVVDAKQRLKRAREYYEGVLAGNVKRRSRDRHERITGQFVLAEAALGNPAAFIDLPVMKSDPKGFKEATRAIEREVSAVYTYFSD